MILFNRAETVGSELEAIREAVANSKLSGDGPFNERCQSQLSHLLGGAPCFLVPSCTAALEMAALLVDLAPGDEVIMPSYTFVSTANAVVLRGATPLFVDIRPDTLNIDETLIEDAVGPKTKAIMAVHYAGVPAEMDAINAIAARRGLRVIEDAAQAIGSTYRGRSAGTLGHLAAFSFHETKNIISGEGGALVVNDASLESRAEIIREKGTNRRNFSRGLVDKYTWVDVGSSFLVSELVAAFLSIQISHADTIKAERMNVWQTYEQQLRGLERCGYRLPVVPEHCEHNAHMFYLLAPTPDKRDALIRNLRQDGILAPFHYVPLHSAPAGRIYGRSHGSLAKTDDLSARVIRLPLYRGLNGADLECVIDKVLKHAANL